VKVRIKGFGFTRGSPPPPLARGAPEWGVGFRLQGVRRKVQGVGFRVWDAGRGT